jgi:hypothetical protein
MQSQIIDRLGLVPPNRAQTIIPIGLRRSHKFHQFSSERKRRHTLQLILRAMFLCFQNDSLLEAIGLDFNPIFTCTDDERVKNRKAIMSCFIRIN